MGKLKKSSAWKNNVNAFTGGISMLLSPHAYKALSLVQRVSPRFLVAILMETHKQESSAETVLPMSQKKQK